MPPSVRLPSHARDHGKALINAGTDRLKSVVRSRKKSLLYVGAALALAGAGSASAATVASSGSAPLANAPVSSPVIAGSASHTSPLSPAATRTASPAALTAPPAAGAPAILRHVVKPQAVAHTAVVKHGTAPRPAARHAAAPRRPAVAARAVAHHGAAVRASTRHQRAAESRRVVAARLRHAARARHLRPYLIYDSVTPGSIPAHHLVATYATGGYAVPAAQVAGRRVLWIDTNGSDPRASALDIEPGDATPTMAAAWVRAKLSANPHALARLYTMQSEWPAVQAAVATLPAHMRAHVRYWIADPTGYPHMVPGADATQWYWGKGYDITTAKPRF